MNHRTLALMLFFSACTCSATDFVRHTDNRPQTLSGQTVQVINFWATWCKPCRKEMPELDKWYQTTGKKQKINMIGLAIDDEKNVSNFLKSTPVSYPIWRYVGKDSRKMMKTYGNTIGALPYTAVRAPQCGHSESLFGEISATRLNTAIQTALAACTHK